MKKDILHDIETDFLIVDATLRKLLKKYQVEVIDSIEIERRLHDIKLKIDRL